VEINVRIPPKSVIHCPPSLSEHQLVSIRQYVKKDGNPTLSAPLALGRMALPSNELKGKTEEKGKAVHIVHTWKDHFWDMGSKCDPPEDTIMKLAAPVADEDSSEGEDTDEESDEESEDGATPPPASEKAPSPTSGPSDPIPISYSPQEVTELLNKALVQAISKALPSSALPIPATLLYQTYILPNRPAFPSLILPPTSNVQTTDSSGDLPRVDTEITIKSSSHKSLTTFLKAAEKTGLITLKPPQKLQPDVMVTAVNMTHPIFASHTPFATVKDVEATAAKKAARDDGKAADSVVEVEAVELLMPNGNHQATGDLFEAMGAKLANSSSYQIKCINPSAGKMDYTLPSKFENSSTPMSKITNSSTKTREPISILTTTFLRVSPRADQSRKIKMWSLSLFLNL